MEVMKQGSDYEEKKVEILEDPKPKIPKKFIILGGLVLLVGILIVGVTQVISGDSESSTEVVSTEGDEGVLTDDMPILSYSDEEREQLRIYGYTGDEITTGEMNAVPASDMVAQARKGREELLRDMYIELNPNASNPQSKEFKELLNLTWLSGKPTSVTAADPTNFITTQLKENVRYVKIPARGVQLFVKLTLDSNGQSIFFNVEPQRYYQLKNSGNMVITYDLVEFGSGSFVTNIQEVAI